MSFRNTSRLSNSMDPDNAQHFNLNLPSTVDKEQANVWCSLSLMYIPYSLFLVDSLNLNGRHKLFTYLCRLPITFANNFDPDQAQQNVGHDLDPNCLALYWYSRKIILEKATTRNKLILKKNINRRQNHDKLPRRQYESMNWNGRCYMYMHVSCLSLIFVCFQYGTV